MGFRVLLDGVHWLGVASDGWTFVSLDHVAVRVRYQWSRSGRRVAEHVTVEGDSVSATDMRVVQLGKMETILSSPRCLAAAQSGADGVDLDPCRTDRLSATRIVTSLSRLNLGPVGLTVPPGRSRHDDFYAAVVDAFASALTRSDKPATVVADATGVPVSTVHGWLREARKRGLGTSFGAETPLVERGIRDTDVRGERRRVRP